MSATARSPGHRVLAYAPIVPVVAAVALTAWLFPVERGIVERGIAEREPARTTPARPVDASAMDADATMTPPPPAAAVPIPQPVVHPAPTSAGGPRRERAAAAPPTDDAGVRPAPAAVRIVARAWASAAAGTPFAAAGVPPGALPVGNRAGRIDKASFVRLAGDGTALTMTADPGGERAALGGVASVVACRITTPGWREGEAVAFDAAPRWDARACVVGVAGDGEWTFDLSSFADRTDDRGFALVPAPDAAVDFQVAFRVEPGDS